MENQLGLRFIVASNKNQHRPLKGHLALLFNEQQSGNIKQRQNNEAYKSFNLKRIKNNQREPGSICRMQYRLQHNYRRGDRKAFEDL